MALFAFMQMLALLLLPFAALAVKEEASCVPQASMDRALAEAFEPSSMLSSFVLGSDPFGMHFSMPFSTGSSPTARGMQRAMPMDVLETKDAIEIYADIPGVEKSKISLSAEQDLLTISVDSTGFDGPAGDGDVKWHRAERSRSFVKRSIRLPEHADPSEASASMDQGVLKIRIQKREPVKTSKQILIS